MRPADQLHEDRKGTQRERLLRSMTDVAAAEGYVGATIAEVILHAGVSRPTFYEYFADKDECFLAAAGSVHVRLLAAIRRSIAKDPPDRAVQSAVHELTAFASSEPAMARVLMHETMAAGPRALAARDEQIAEIAQTIEGAQRDLPPEAETPDLSVRMMLGAIYRLLAARFREDQHEFPDLLPGLLDWIKSYEQPITQHRWSSLAAASPAAPSSHVPRTPLRAPPALPSSPRRSRAQAAENQRQRIMFATAKVAIAKGYTATTAADICKAADVDPRAFSRLFGDKQEAYMAIANVAFERTMAVTAGAYFAGSSWPEQTWLAGTAFTQFLENNPTLANVAFVESYAVGHSAVKRVDELLNAFTIFLQPGYEHAREHPPGPIALEAIAATNFEICYQQARKNPGPRITELQPHATFLSLAPFLGPTDANRFIDEKLSVGAGA